MDQVFYSGNRPPGKETNPAIDDAARLVHLVGPLVEKAKGESWYERYDNPVDAAVIGLCRLRRAAAGERRSVTGGDDAVRSVLAQSDPEAVVWLASRFVSYMDEQGFPEQVERMFG